jgi:hypothetical protein
LVSFIWGGQHGYDTVHKIEVCSEVVGCIPFNTADIRGRGDRRTWRREVTLVVWTSVQWGLFAEEIFCLWQRNDVQVVKEDPEHLLCHVGDLFAPNSIGTGLIDTGDEG